MSNLCVVSEAAAIIGCTPANIRALERSGRLRAEKTATGIRLFTLEDVNKLAEERASAKEQKQAAKAA